MPRRARGVGAHAAGVERHRARRKGLVGRGGAVTAIQRCRSAPNTNVQFHSLVADGVLVTRPDGGVRFAIEVRA